MQLVPRDLSGAGGGTRGPADLRRIEGEICQAPNRYCDWQRDALDSGLRHVPRRLEALGSDVEAVTCEVG
jgi:hypothetical protein